MKILELFAGTRSIGKAFELQGHEVFSVEWNKNFEDIDLYEDISNVTAEQVLHDFGSPDVIWASPDCTTFSIAGQREESWGKKKKFREGQAEQTLDDLSFVFIETVAKLKPKVVIMENVEGLLKGEAWKYVQGIYKKLNDIGYSCRHWLLKCEYMGIPQKRHRVFFVATRLDCDLTKINMDFNYEPVTYSDIKTGKGDEYKKSSQQYRMLEMAIENLDHSVGDVLKRTGQKESCFNDKIIWESEVLPTLPAKGNLSDGHEKTRISRETAISMSTFPQDYDFGTKSYNGVAYVCGMSVPPVMIKRIVTRLIESGLFNYKTSIETN